MANKKKFRCTNYGNGCPNADNNIEIELEELDILEGNIKCPHCKQELEEIPQKGGVNIKLFAGIGAAVIALVIGGFFIFRGDSKKTSETGTQSEVVDQQGKGEKPTDPVIPEIPDNVNTVVNGNGYLKLSYGLYSGDIKDGYPHGQGRLTYSKERQINRYDMKKRKASAGEYIIGEFQRGFFIQGRLYKANGELIGSVMIGTAPGETYDEK